MMVAYKTNQMSCLSMLAYYTVFMQHEVQLNSQTLLAQHLYNVVNGIRQHGSAACVRVVAVVVCAQYQWETSAILGGAQ